jgi:hypothetical protein
MPAGERMTILIDDKQFFFKYPNLFTSNKHE